MTADIAIGGRAGPGRERERAVTADGGALLDRLDAAVVAWDRHGRVTCWSAGAERLYGWSAREVLGGVAWDVGGAAASVARVRASLSRRLLADGPWDEELEVTCRDGSLAAVHSRLAALRDAEGELEGFVAVSIDARARRRSARQLERRVAQQAAVAAIGERALEGVDSTELVHGAVAVLFQHLDAGCAAYLEGDGGDLLVRAAMGLPKRWVGRRRATSVAELLPGGSSITASVRRRDETLGVLAVHARAADAFDADDHHFLQSLANVLSDALERERAEHDTRHDALHDRVTGLPNRALALDRLEHALAARARRGRHRVAVIFSDLDHFKLVNDTLGHAAGDELLRQVAPRLVEAVRPSDTVARFGGDEFVLLCEDVTEHDALEIAQRVLRVFAAPFQLGGRDHLLSTSVGIALAGQALDTPKSLLRDADAAMYAAKNRGRGTYELFGAVRRG